MKTKLHTDNACLALDQLLTAYARGESTDSIEWEDLDNAFECAQAALPGRYEEILKELEEDES